MLFLFLFGLATLGSLGYLIYAYIQYRLRLQRLRLQTELVETKANYFANITHELKTPLQLLTGPLENLHSKLSTDLGNEKLITWLDTAQKQAQRIKILVQQMETLKKIDEAVLTDHIEPIDLFAFADGIKNSFEALALKQNLRIHVVSNLNSSLIVQMDHSHLTTIFNNLIQNVLDHSATAKNIWIRLFDEKDQVNIEIQDDGQGILPQIAPIIQSFLYQGCKWERHGPYPLLPIGSGLVLMWPLWQQKTAKKWTPEEKLKAIIETSAMSEEELGAFLCREGLHSHQPQEWREEVLKGLQPAPRKPQSRKDERDEKIKDLERELRRKDKALAEARRF